MVMKKAKARVLSVLLMGCLMLVAAGCGNKAESVASNNTPGNTSTNTPAATESGTDWAARKAENEKVGTITYITGYYYAASPPDIETVMAQELGYFKELGLNVKIQPGLDSEGMKFLAAGQAQIASAGTPSLVIQSVASGAPIKGIATFGASGTGAIMVMDDSPIKGPKDLEGKTLGFHGALPANYEAMFKNSGVDVTKIKGVSVGYDPTILSSGKVDALTVYKSNEPYIMEQAGHKVRLIDPGQYGAETSFGVIAANNDFAKAHPEAVEDFLRAVSKAHGYALAHPDESLKVLEKQSQSTYDIKAETNRWSVESKILEGSKSKGHGVAWQANEQWQREITMLFNSKVIKKTLDVNDVMDNRYIDSIYDRELLIWPQS
ncbi:nitrate ABC transporter substrate-binding protein [Paenibacillus baekrokdamisoli]|uniref:Nitrate ABC transporter substrate-binding protein n=1 Tax=Paenibacillus baekrokdamisoli TaxID=1712516 RepID=A0A3G9JH88_9BACL|nr:ABC transporter substrate-binding protein [Paenibacillus baekrokdamisoli]MBB3068495.1 NitT/TauT family transport system substrate-binding protein [Paenibacillus baekrokdamisoli]BBH22464.1 nitrate ABC transporter substrate-binding protein [Paenibacillus baekrokdamisoli]